LGKEDKGESYVGPALDPLNQTGWKHVQTYGSVDKRHVPGDDGYSCLRQFQLTQLLYKERINNYFTYALYITMCIFLSVG
jgi:hypothetical protein